ncbi:MAG: sulfite exporter TauE/SafE family protein [Acidobacteriia bacterium]|nr:sulfite exporter TauE/SafE family protein [Terriglobia bacterium]
MSLVIILFGFGVGLLVGLFGIGGGIVVVPALVYLLRMDQHLAQGTSLFILLPPLGLGALFHYWKRGDVDLRAGILSALGILVGGYLGSRIAIPMASNHLRGGFGCFVMVSAFLLWRKTLQTSPNTADAPTVRSGA